MNNHCTLLQASLAVISYHNCLHIHQWQSFTWLLMTINDCCWSLTNQPQLTSRTHRTHPSPTILHQPSPGDRFSLLVKSMRPFRAFTASAQWWLGVGFAWRLLHEGLVDDKSDYMSLIVVDWKFLDEYWIMFITGLNERLADKMVIHYWMRWIFRDYSTK